MVHISFPHFSFAKRDDLVIVTYAQYYFFELPLSDFLALDSEFDFSDEGISLPNLSEKSAQNKMNRLIHKGLQKLIRKANNRKVLYIDEDSDIPLIGSNEFGIVDRDTNIIEIKPLTGCNLSCIYCSVDEGKNNKLIDILIDPDYLVNACIVVASPKTHRVEFNIGPHGEPLLYPFMEELISGLKLAFPDCIISINTNGTLLSKKKIDILQKAGLTRINLSLNSLQKQCNDALANQPYPLDHILKMLDYCKEVDMSVLLAPLLIPGYNDSSEDVESLVKLASTFKSPFPTIGFQKFLMYKGGRNPVKKEQSFEDFFALLKPLEEKYGLVLTPKADYNPFGIFKDKTLIKPFLKQSFVRARIICTGRVPSEKLCTAGDRLITVRGLFKDSGTVNVRIVRDKHNVFIGAPN